MLPCLSKNDIAKVKFSLQAGESLLTCSQLVSTVVGTPNKPPGEPKAQQYGTPKPGALIKNLRNWCQVTFDV